MREPTSPHLAGFPARVLAVFVSPGKLVEQLRSRPVSALAILLVVAVNVTAVTLFPVELFEEQIRTAMQDAGTATQDLPMETLVVATRFTGIAAAGIMPVAMAFVTAALMLFVFTTILEGDGRYRQYLSIVAHASIIPAVGGLLIVPLKISQGDMTLTLGIGTFTPFLDDGLLLMFLKMMDFFALWSLVVVAIGVRRIDGRRSLGSAFGILLGFWMVFALGMAALAS